MSRQEPINAVGLTYAAVFEPAEEGGFVVSFPILPGLMTQGETLEEARVMAADLLVGYVELMRERGKPLPASDAGPGEPPAAKLRMA